MEIQTGVAFIVGQLGLGGAEQQLYYLLSVIDRRRFHPIVVSLGPQADEYWERRIRKLEIPVWHLARSLGRARRTKNIASLLRTEKIDLVHAWDFHTNPYSALAGRLAGVPLRIGSMRGEHQWVTANKLVSALGYRGLDVLVINSASAAANVQKLGVTKACIRVVSNGIEITEPRSDCQCRHLKAGLGFAPEHRVVGTIGRMDTNKNHAMLLRVFASLSDKWPMLRLVIVGDGPLRSELAIMADRLGIGEKVRFPGIIPMAARYLPALEVFCLTSYTEGMSNVIMEAAAAGVPVVSTGYTGSGELVEHETTGYLIQPNDDVAMAAYVDELLMNQERRHQIGNAGREKIRREYSLEAMRSNMTRVYEDALAAKGLA
jgi:glycosyltransferase involved in cell wall biosynthesis